MAKVPGKIFGLGLSRTGTLSLTAALKLLGFRTMHYPNDSTTRRELMAAQYELTILREIDAVMDIPLIPFYPQLDRAYPGSKFILSTRPTERWLSSVENHFRMYVEHRRDPFDDFVLACVYGALHFNAERFAYVKQAHEDGVRRYFANRPDDLLILDVSEGHAWEPLGRLLGCSVPNEPFPHRNTALATPSRSTAWQAVARLWARWRGSD